MIKVIYEHKVNGVDYGKIFNGVSEKQFFNAVDKTTELDYGELNESEIVNKFCETFLKGLGVEEALEQVPIINGKIDGIERRDVILLHSGFTNDKDVIITFDENFDDIDVDEGEYNYPLRITVDDQLVLKYILLDESANIDDEEDDDDTKIDKHIANSINHAVEVLSEMMSDKDHGKASEDEKEDDDTDGVNIILFNPKPGHMSLMQYLISKYKKISITKLAPIVGPVDNMSDNILLTLKIEDINYEFSMVDSVLSEMGTKKEWDKWFDPINPSYKPVVKRENI